MKVITNFAPPRSLAGKGLGATFRVGLVQERWRDEPTEHEGALHEGARLAVAEGARLICFQELTLSRYFADVLPNGNADRLAEPLEDGPTVSFARDVATRLGVHVAASLFERSPTSDGLGFNTSIVLNPAGELLTRTRKLHIPKTTGYYEDRYFRQGPASPDAFPLANIEDVRVGVPTCWDQWFPELARAYALRGAQLVLYPTAIGSEPDFPDFDTAPLWRHTMVAHAIANGLFVAAVNRVGSEGLVTFYGSSFIADPYGRILVEAPRDESAVLVADLALGQRDDWLTLFPFLETRRPDAYDELTKRTQTE